MPSTSTDLDPPIDCPTSAALEIPVLRTMTGGRFVYVNPDTDPNQKVEYFRYPARTSYTN